MSALKLYIIQGRITGIVIEHSVRKLIPYLERKKDKLDPVGELELERAFNVQTVQTMQLWLFNTVS